MVKLSIKSLALKWYFFTCVPGGSLLLEYFNLFMKQLGFNSAQIGLTTLFGAQYLFIPICHLLGEKYRARNAVAIFGTLTQTLSSVLPLLVFVIPALLPSCNDISDVKPKKLAILGHVSVNSKYVNNSSNLSTSTTNTVPIIATIQYR